MKNILSAFVITVAALFPSISIAATPDPIQIAECQTPLDIMRQARQVGSELIDGLVDQELLRAKQFVSDKEGTPVEQFDFDRLEAYKHPNPAAIILIRYKEGCAVGSSLVELSKWEQLLEAARGTDS